MIRIVEMRRMGGGGGGGGNDFKSQYNRGAAPISCLLYHFNFPWQMRSKRKFLFVFLSLSTEVGLCKLPGNQVYIIYGLFCEPNAVYFEHLIFFCSCYACIYISYQ